VRDEARIREVVSDMYAAFGRIDILVNNAGVSSGGPVEQLPEEQWDLNMDVNLKGTFLMSKAVIPYMKEQGWGRILNAASFAAIIPRIDTAAYAASKAGVEQFTRVLAGELGPWGITVNCYAPGMIPTGMNGFDTLPESRKKLLLDTLTIRRWGLMEDVAHLIIYLASDYAGYITGTMIDVSGGKLATQLPQDAYVQAAEQISPAES
jgi:3-oxoacyl-[acyl-carrier protein] reductase